MTRRPPTRRAVLAPLASLAALTLCTGLAATAQLALLPSAQAATPAAAATAPATAPSPFAGAQQLFLKASAGDDDAVDPAAEQLARLVAAAPGDTVLLAYAGAAKTLRARASWLPWRKLRHADDGLAQIDKALALLPGDARAAGPSGLAPALEVRFVAANTFLALPAMFNRQARGEQLLAELQALPAFAAAPEGFRRAVQQRARQLKAAAP